MSFYNMLFGTNPAAGLLLAMIGVKREDTGRFRDCYLSENGQHIIIYTRNGGGNRESYQDVFDALSKHPLYVSDEDDDYDCTYASIKFKVPEICKPAVKILLSEGTETGAQKWQRMLKALESDQPTPESVKALEVGKAIFQAFEDKGKTTISNAEGSVTVKNFNMP